MKVLVIDDNKDTGYVLEEALKQSGYDVLLAYNGEEGFEMAKKHLPDIILLDIMMPKMDGYTMNSMLKKNAKTKDIPVIVISAKGKLLKLFDLTSQKVDFYLEKPFKISELLNIIKKVIK